MSCFMINIYHILSTSFRDRTNDVVIFFPCLNAQMSTFRQAQDSGSYTSDDAHAPLFSLLQSSTVASDGLVERYGRTMKHGSGTSLLHSIQ
jgi:hypothetical protein